MPEIQFTPEINAIGIFGEKEDTSYVVDANHVDDGNHLFVAVPHRRKSVVISDEGDRLLVRIFDFEKTQLEAEAEVEYADEQISD